MKIGLRNVSLLGNDKSLVINDADSAKFFQCEFSKAYALGGSGTGTIEISSEGTGAEFHGCRFEQNNADGDAYLLQCSGENLQVFGGKFASSTISSPNYLVCNASEYEVRGTTGLHDIIRGQDGPRPGSGGGLVDQGIVRSSYSSVTLDSTTLTPNDNIITISFNSFNIDNIEASNRQGMFLVLKFNGSGTVRDVSTAAGNLRLAGSADYSPGTTDTLTLMCDGTNWFEVARSNN